MKRFILFLAVMALLTIGMGAPASAKPPKMDNSNATTQVCHSRGSQGHFSLWVSQQGAEGHMKAGHGDGYPGDAVPNMNGYVFDANCSTVPGCSWTGDWNTSYGPLTLVQDGDSVTGAYPRFEGTIDGTVSGNILTGRFHDYAETPDERSGPMEFTIDPEECNSFEGLWAYDPYDLRSVWDGTRQ